MTVLQIYKDLARSWDVHRRFQTLMFVRDGHQLKSQMFHKKLNYKPPVVLRIAQATMCSKHCASFSCQMDRAFNSCFSTELLKNMMMRDIKLFVNSNTHPNTFLVFAVHALFYIILTALECGRIDGRYRARAGKDKCIVSTFGKRPDSNSTFLVLHARIGEYPVVSGFFWCMRKYESVLGCICMYDSVSVCIWVYVNECVCIRMNLYVCIWV